MQVQSQAFKAAARAAILNPDLQAALQKSRGGFIDKRQQALDEFDGFDALRDQAVAIKNHVLMNLDEYLKRFEDNVTAAGGQVHFASTPAEGAEVIRAICKRVGAQCVTKGKSMIGEEMELNEALENDGIEVVETDLGEYIIQLAKERPSHIIAPAIHKTRSQITDLFSKHHAQHGLTERVEEVEAIVNEARTVLRQQFVKADVGITGANFLIADSGSSVLVTNEGNGDLTSTLPKVHVITASIEKIIPSQAELPIFLRLLARSATGQEMSAYTSIYSGAARPDEIDGPGEFHVLLLDNGRSDMLGGPYWEMLRCIRCGACMNHCPVYQSIGGHAYGWVYPGPMGSVWTPLLVGLQNAANLPNACTLNGRCQEVCPMKIPLPGMLRRLRSEIFERGLADWRSRAGLAVWTWLATHAPAYRALTRLAGAALRRIGNRKGYFRRLPLAGGWTEHRDFPAPSGSSFVSGFNRGETGE